MSCKEYEQKIIAYALGELETNITADIQAHLETCEYCKDIYESYACIVSTINNEPEPCPSLAESEALTRALMQVNPTEQREIATVPKGLPAMILGSVLVFLTMASILALQVLGYLNIADVVRKAGVLNIVFALALTVFITSFIPIAAMARRRPLNGMTFRR